MKRMAQKLLVTVGAKANVFEEFEIPANRFEGKKLDHFLQAIICRYITNNAQKMIPYYVSSRAGEPKRTVENSIGPYFHYESRRCGRFCGSWEMHAYATFEMNQVEADGLSRINEKNRRASLQQARSINPDD